MKCVTKTNHVSKIDYNILWLALNKITLTRTQLADIHSGKSELGNAAAMMLVCRPIRQEFNSGPVINSPNL